jgi:PPK2 family polyphosphate:nucleotide phosphotransferase
MIDRKRYLVRPGEKVDLSKRDPGHTSGYAGKSAAAEKLKRDAVKLAQLQERLAAEVRHGMLVIFQGIDTAGKDGAIAHVMAGVNPQGVSVHSFKQPSDEERRHDFLWRSARVAPERGRIGIFNRSYYEDVLIVRVHPDLLAGDSGGPMHPGGDFWKRRYESINAYERHLTESGISVVKFFLHISKVEQRKRLAARLDDPKKQWKFSLADLQQREYWDRYVDAFEEMLRHTSTAHAPWYVIPSDHKWFTRVAVADILVGAIADLHPKYPPLARDVRERMAALRATLAEK